MSQIVTSPESSDSTSTLLTITNNTARSCIANLNRPPSCLWITNPEGLGSKWLARLQPLLSPVGRCDIGRFGPNSALYIAVILPTNFNSFKVTSQHDIPWRKVWNSQSLGLAHLAFFQHNYPSTLYQSDTSGGYFKYYYYHVKFKSPIGKRCCGPADVFLFVIE